MIAPLGVNDLRDLHGGGDRFIDDEQPTSLQTDAAPMHAAIQYVIIEDAGFHSLGVMVLWVYEL